MIEIVQQQQPGGVGTKNDGQQTEHEKSAITGGYSAHSLSSDKIEQDGIAELSAERFEVEPNSLYRADYGMECFRYRSELFWVLSEEVE